MGCAGVAMIFMALGSVGTLSSALLEWKLHEPLYKIFMKIFPWFFGVGGVLLALESGGVTWP